MRRPSIEGRGMNIYKAARRVKGAVFSSTKVLSLLKIPKLFLERPFLSASYIRCPNSL